MKRAPEVTVFLDRALLLATPKDALSNDTRRRIFEYIRDHPGVHLRAVARGVGLDTNHTKYHVVHLEQCNLVSTEHVHGHWVFFPLDNDAVPDWHVLEPNEKAQLFLLRKKVPRAVVKALLRDEEASHKELQEAAKVSASTLYYHLRRMEEKEVIVGNKFYRTRYWRLRSPELTRRFLQVCEAQVAAADHHAPDKVPLVRPDWTNGNGHDDPEEASVIRVVPDDE